MFISHEYAGEHGHRICSTLFGCILEPHTSLHRPGKAAGLLSQVSYMDAEAGRLISVFAGELAKRSLLLSIQPVFFCYQASYD